MRASYGSGCQDIEAGERRLLGITQPRVGDGKRRLDA
jgi:hypothetical protein